MKMSVDLSALAISVTKPNGKPAIMLSEMGINIIPIEEDEGNIDRYVLSKRLAVERRTGSSFLQGIKDKSLYTSAIYLSENFDIPILILEGEVSYKCISFNPQAVRGALSALMLLYGLNVLSTTDIEETVNLIAMMARQEQAGVREISLVPKRKATDLPDMQRRIVEMLPGCGMVMARNLLKRFGSVKRIVEANEEDFRELEGIGAKKATEIHRVLNAEYGDVDTEKDLEDAIESYPELLFEQPVTLLARQHYIFTEQNTRHIVDLVFLNSDADELVLVELKRGKITRESYDQIRRYLDNAHKSQLLKPFLEKGMSIRGILATTERCEFEPESADVSLYIADVSLYIIDKARAVKALKQLWSRSAAYHPEHIVKRRKGHWESYALIDGLPDVNVLAILQDSQGRIWFGTEDGGVSRYDGRNFMNFTTEDGLPSNNVRAILEDREGCLWFGFGAWGFGSGGVCRYDGQNFDRFTTEDGLAGNNVWCIHEGRDGCLWFGTFGGGVSRYDGQNFTNFTYRDGLPDNRVSSILEDRSGNFWFGTYGHGVSFYNRQGFVNFNSGNGLTGNRVTSIVEDNSGKLWFGTYGDGVSCYDGQKFVNFSTDDGLPDSRVTAIMEDGDGNLWFGTYGGGVCCYDGKSFMTFTTEDGLSDNRVTVIMEDREKYLWFGTYTGGVSRYDRGSLVTYGTEDGLASNDVRVVLEDRQGNMWFGTAEGVSCYDGSGIVNYTTADGLGHDDIRSALEDRDGNLWFGTYGGGICRYDGKSFATFTTKDGLCNDFVWSIGEDREGGLWFGTYGGVSRYKTGSFQTFSSRDGLASDHVWSILQDKEGRMWFGTVDGLSCYDGKSFAKFSEKDGLAHNHVWAILEDTKGSLWVATRGGVNCYDGQSFQKIITKDGLPCKNVRSILEDREGHLWFGTNGGGVCKYDGRNVQNITTRDGLAHDTVRQMIQDKAGNFWFATPNRVTEYHPLPLGVKPLSRITQAIADKVYTDTEEIESPASRVAFEYSGLSLKTRFDSIKYIYRLEGRDTEWSQATHERIVSYENLKPGEYVFQVKAIDRDLNYSDAAQVKLRIIPDPRNHKIAQLENRIREQEQAEMERIYRELEDARQIQQSLLPRTEPVIPGFDIAAVSFPAREVGGDFYDYLPLGKHFGIVLADVCGKSLRAAMVAAMTNGMLHAQVKDREDLWESPGNILTELNVTLQPRLTDIMFTTMSLAILNPEGKCLRACNAGMPYPIVKQGRKTHQLEVGGLPLGIMNDAEYSEMGVNLNAGDFVIFYSDGVSEAINSAEQLYQTERLIETVQNAATDFSAREMVDFIIQDVNKFVADVEPSDDITIAVLRCLE